MGVLNFVCTSTNKYMLMGLNMPQEWRKPRKVVPEVKNHFNKANTGFSR